MKDKIFYLILCFLSVAALVTIVTFSLNKKSDQKQRRGAPIPIDTLLSGDINQTGPKDSKAILVGFEDFQCPACKSVQEDLKTLKTDYPDLNFVFKHNPLTNIHPYAYNAAVASEAAAVQGKFWEYHDVLFEKQTNNISKADFIQFAKDLGLDEKKFEKDLDSEVLKTKVDDAVKFARENFITGTPTFYLNGEAVSSLRAVAEKLKEIYPEVAKKLEKAQEDSKKENEESN